MSPEETSKCRRSDLYSSMNLKNIRTYIQSGNVLFESQSKDLDLDGMRAELELRMAKQLGFEIKVILRSLDQIRSVVKKNPFKNKNENFLHVTFLQKKPGKYSDEEMRKAVTGSEDCRILGSEVYLFCPHGYGQTQLDNSFFERKLGVSSTTRNWRTVNAFLSVE
jgi:uncharacterized protein (DUF1697 family)